LEADMVNNLNDWLYSNYLEWVGLRSGILFDKNFVNAHFTNAEEYMRFILEYSPTNEINLEIKKLSFENE
jgi:hypothetical protein